MALKIKNREEAIAVLRDMVQRKKEMEKQVQEEFAQETYRGLREFVPHR